MSDNFFIGVAILIFCHAVYYRFQWRNPNRLYHMGVSNAGHQAYMRLVEFEIIASIIGVATTLFAGSLIINLLEATGVLVIALLFAAAAMAEVWSRDKIKKVTFLKRLVIPTAFGIFVSMPAVFRAGKRWAEVWIAQ